MALVLYGVSSECWGATSNRTVGVVIQLLTKNLLGSSGIHMRKPAVYRGKQGLQEVAFGVARKMKHVLEVSHVERKMFE